VSRCGTAADCDDFAGDINARSAWRPGKRRHKTKVSRTLPSS
jgi:hypothetical protein